MKQQNRDSKLLEEWFVGAKSQEDREEIKRRLSSHQFLLDLLLDIIDRRIEDTPRITDYDHVNWAYKQADRNGGLRQLQLLKKLIESAKV